MGAVCSRVEFVHVGRGRTERGFDDGCGDIANIAVVVAIYAQWNVVLKADKPNESLNDAYGTRDVARSCGTGIANMLAFFAVSPVFLCTVLDKGASDRRAGGVKCVDLGKRDSDLIVRQESNVVNTKGTSFASDVQMRIVKSVVAVGLGPFAKSKAVEETDACPVDDGGKRRIAVVNVRSRCAQCA